MMVPAPPRPVTLAFGGSRRAEVGALPYWYFVKYRPDVHAALHELREREFRAGRYNPVLPLPPFPVRPGSPTPGARHRTIREALRAAGADGTRSILDLERVSEKPAPGAAAPFPDELLLRLYGTTRPNRQMVERGADSEYIERGQGIYIIVYRDTQPDELYFAGYSYD
jgi:hypothetical protein